MIWFFLVLPLSCILELKGSPHLSPELHKQKETFVGCWACDGVVYRKSYNWVGQ